MSSEKQIPSATKIDLHTHLGMISAEDRIKADRLLDIRKCVILPFPDGAELRIDGRQIKPFLCSDAYEVCQTYPDHFAWMCNIVPTGAREDYETLKRYKETGAIGVGEFSTTIPFDCKEMDYLFDCLEELDMVFLFHMAPEKADRFYGIQDDPRLPRLERMLKKHPDVRVFGHSQVFWSEMSKTDETDPDRRNSYPTGKVTEGRIAELMRTYGNLYGDLSAGSGGNALLRDPEYGIRFIHEFHDRLLFGTDWGGGSFRFPLGPWLDYLLHTQQISEEIHHNICYANAERILRI